jgi:hypothetical protein
MESSSNMKKPLRISETRTNITVRSHKGLKPIHYRQAKKKAADLETWRTVVTAGQSRNITGYKNEAYDVLTDVSHLFQVTRLEVTCVIYWDIKYSTEPGFQVTRHLHKF